MRLLQALQAFIEQVPNSGPVFFTETLDLEADNVTIIRDAGSWDNDPTRCWQYPVVEVVVRTADQDAGTTLAGALAGALNTGRRLELAPGWMALRSTVPSPPEADGRDQQGRWLRRFEVNFLLHAAAAI